MKIYNEKFLGDVRFPILDKYFLVYKSIADYESGVAVPPVDEMTFPSIEFDSSSWEYAQAWMAKNNDKIKSIFIMIYIIIILSTFIFSINW